MTDLVKTLIDQAETVCDSVRNDPSGCEGCWLFSNWLYNREDLEENEDEEGEEFECPMRATIDTLTSLDDFPQHIETPETFNRIRVDN